MAAAYEHASDPDAPRPFELSLLGYIDRFGVEAVMGRKVLSAGEIKRMIIAENIYNAYKSRAASDNWGKWAMDNPTQAKILSLVEGNHNAD